MLNSNAWWMTCRASSSREAATRVRKARPALCSSSARAWLRPACLCKASSCDTCFASICTAATRLHVQGFVLQHLFSFHL